MKIFVCSNPACRASHMEDPQGHCPACAQRTDAGLSGWSTVACEVTRRIRTDLATPAEAAIRDAMLAVEEAGADPLLTDAVNLRQAARDKVSDYVDRPRG